MHTFTDNAGNTWTVTVNVDAIKRVKGLTGINLLDVLGGELMERLSSDPVLLCDVLYAVCKEQTDAKGVSDEAFGRSMAGDAIDGATSALLEELIEFFPLARRKQMKAAWEKLQRLQTVALDWAGKKLEGDELERKMLLALESGPGGSAGSLPASSASIPAASPSAS